MTRACSLARSRSTARSALSARPLGITSPASSSARRLRPRLDRQSPRGQRPEVRQAASNRWHATPAPPDSPVPGQVADHGPTAAIVEVVVRNASRRAALDPLGQADIEQARDRATNHGRTTLHPWQGRCGSHARSPLRGPLAPREMKLLEDALVLVLGLPARMMPA